MTGATTVENPLDPRQAVWMGGTLVSSVVLIVLLLTITAVGH
jgi:hypothetical protein